MSVIGNILVVDDEPAFQRICGNWLTEQGHKVSVSGNAEEAAKIFTQGNFDIALLDLALPPSLQPQEGLALLSQFNAVPVIVITGHGDRELALRAVEQGAWDFLTKPVDPEMLKVVVTRALEKHRLEKELRILRSQISIDNMGIIGNSKPIQELRSLIKRIAPADINVMILGPSGTGKELVARAIHKLSRRNNKPFVALHCGAIPSELLESELFGYVKGSFTGADRDKIGLLDIADGGALFLDEVGDMPPQMQVKMLRFLQDGSFIPIGGRKEKHADMRIISATHRDIENMVKQGGFREDLYYRLKGIVVKTPSLKDRMEDIPVLAANFLQLFSKGKTKTLSTQALAYLLKQPWHGNVRELENLLECSVVLSGDRDAITLDDVQMAMSGDKIGEEASIDHSLNSQVAVLEKSLIIAAFEDTGRNYSQTARNLGISRQGLLKKMQRLGLR